MGNSYLKKSKDPFGFCFQSQLKKYQSVFTIFPDLNFYIGMSEIGYEYNK